MKTLLVLLFLATRFGLHAQSLRPAVSLTYLNDNAVPDRSVQHHEFSLNTNLIYELTPKNNVGLQYIFIRTIGSGYKYSEEITDFYIAGIFYQKDFLPKSKNELLTKSFLE